MLSAIGSGMICITSAYFGFYMAERLKKRYCFLREMINALLFIERETEFGKYELSRLFKKLEGVSALGGFFKLCRNGMEENGIKQAWRDAAKETADKVCLKEWDITTVSELAEELGMTDARGQKKAIKRTVGILNECCKNAEEEYNRLSKPYRHCGVLIGIFFLILFI